MKPLSALRRCLPVLPVLAATAALSATAAAAEPTLDPLPEATHAAALTTGPDGEVWFHGLLAERPEFIGSYRADGALEEFPLPQNRRAGAPVAGPGGDLWFGEDLVNRRGRFLPRVGRMSTAGDFSDYMLGNRLGSTTDVAPLGGSVWFGVERLGDDGRRGSIGRLDPGTGEATTVVQMAPRCKPGRMVATADAVLFVEICRLVDGAGDVRHRVSLDRLDPANLEVSRRRLRHGAPQSLLVAADGSVWFGLAANGYGSKYAGQDPRIGRISPAGLLSEFPAPKAANLSSIALGHEGRLWFPSAVPGHGYPTRGLNSIGPGGELGEPFCISPGCKLEPFGLLARPDGSIWFGGQKTQLIPPSGSSGQAQDIYTAAEAGFIGRFTPGAP
jgi:streptogramin lyase